VKDITSGLYYENYFHEMISIEHKRSERSGTSFLLLTLDISRCISRMKRRPLNEKIVQVARESSREIDIKGWYRYGSVVGIIYTEITEASEKTIKEKLRKNLVRIFAPEFAKHISIAFHIFPQKGTHDSTPDSPEHDPTIYLGRRLSGTRKIELALKRTMDLAVSIVGIIVALPVLAIIAAAVKATSPGPALFKQKRVGQYGRPFTFLKFRSMYVNNNENIHKEFVTRFIKDSKSGPVDARNGLYKMKDDPRITPIGRFIRKTSLDELPQLFNVLWGDMSLVGPRPPIKYEVNEYDTWHRRRVLIVKPGITGLWQVEGRSRTDFDNMVRMDIEYIAKWSFLLDLKLLIQTPFSVLAGKGAC
jgi:exopolysaccharide biosynthesis polyprenyl glycosylphosphotransferase